MGLKVLTLPDIDCVSFIVGPDYVRVLEIHRLRISGAGTGLARRLLYLWRWIRHAWTSLQWHRRYWRRQTQIVWALFVGLNCFRVLEFQLLHIPSAGTGLAHRSLCPWRQMKAWYCYIVLDDGDVSRHKGGLNPKLCPGSHGNSKAKQPKAGIGLGWRPSWHLVSGFWCPLPPMLHPSIVGLTGWTLYFHPAMWEPRGDRCRPACLCLCKPFTFQRKQ